MGEGKEKRKNLPMNGYPLTDSISPEGVIIRSFIFFVNISWSF